MRSNENKGKIIFMNMRNKNQVKITKRLSMSSKWKKRKK